MPERLHILGGGPFQVPSIRRAKQMGLEVLVTDMYQERPGYAIADRHEVIDVVDEEGTHAAARRHGIDAILCDSIDVGVPTAAYVAEQMGLPGMGYQVALRFSKKHRMRRALAEAGLQATRHRQARSLAEAAAAAAAIGYPVVVKPPDSQGSRGVRRVAGSEGLARAFDAAMGHSRSGWVIVEEQLPGREVIVDGLCLDGEVTVLGLGEKDPYPHRPETARRITYPAELSEPVREDLVALNQRIVTALGLRNGLTHAEYMATDAEVRLIEIAARGGGSGIYAHVLPFLTGVDLTQVSIELALGRRPEVALSGEPRAANLHFFDFPAGKLERLEGLDEARKLPGVVDILVTLGAGDRVEPPQDDTERPGPAIVLGQSREEVLAVSREVDHLVRAVVA